MNEKAVAGGLLTAVVPRVALALVAGIPFCPQMLNNRPAMSN